jgi:putative ABC transport system permease protein
MPFMSRIRGISRVLFNRHALEDELNDELQSVFEMLTEEKIAAGLSPHQARREAWLEIGCPEQVKARVRHERHGAALDAFGQDVRHTLRGIRRNPGFTLVAVLILAIGIGATTALFSTISAALLTDLPYNEPDRLVAAYKTRDGRPAAWVSIVDYFDFREHSQSFEGLAAVRRGRSIITGTDEPQIVETGLATWNILHVLDVTPILGRSFLAEEENESGLELALISHGLWRHRFSSSQDVIGQTLELDSTPVTIVGVLPPGFTFLYEADIWRLTGRDVLDSANRDAHSHWVVGRLKPGVSLAQAQQEVDTIARSLEETYPDTNKGKGLGLVSLHGFMAWGLGPRLLPLMATAVLVLLVACCNVAGLLLARGHRRLPEMAMRTALGASRWRLIRQLLTESSILAMLAGATGIGLAFAFQRLLLRLLPHGDPGMPQPAIDAQALLFAVLVSLVTGLLVGIVPAIRGTPLNLAKQIGSGTRTTLNVHGTRLRSGLVIAQVGMSVLLLIGSGLLIRSMTRLTMIDLGFDPDNLFTATVQIQDVDYPDAEQKKIFFSSLLEEIRALPNVESAAAIHMLPVATSATDWPIWRAELPRPTPQDMPLALARVVTPGYFDTIRMPILKGRDIADTDTADSLRVVVISSAVAATLFPNEEPIGRRIGIGWEEEAFEIVGVVGNGRINGIRSDFTRAMYLSSTQLDMIPKGLPFMSLVVRASNRPEALTHPVRRLLLDKDPNALFSDPRTMSAIVSDNVANFRVVLVSLVLLAALALVLTAIGLYGVLAYQVSQRANELGIRLAVGASRTDIVGLVLRRGLALVLGGLVVGVVGALPSTRFLQRMLFEVEPLDPPSFLAAAAFLTVVAAAACLGPALRAARVNLVNVLRPE